MRYAAILLVALALPARAELIPFTDEGDYLAALATRGYGTIEEGFEDDAAWGTVRTTIVGGTHTAPSITHLGLTWTSNNSVSDVTTGHGPALTGEWGFFVLPHGDYANGIGDGFRATSAAAGLLHGAGGWIETNTPFARVNLILDGSRVVNFENVVIGTQHQFLGVIDTDGFLAVEVRETEGTINDQKYIFGDDFTFAVAVPEPSTALLLGLALAACGGWRSLRRHVHPPRTSTGLRRTHGRRRDDQGSGDLPRSVGARDVL